MLYKVRKVYTLTCLYHLPKEKHLGQSSSKKKRYYSGFPVCKRISGELHHVFLRFDRARSGHPVGSKTVSGGGRTFVDKKGEFSWTFWVNFSGHKRRILVDTFQANFRGHCLGEFSWTLKANSRGHLFGEFAWTLFRRILVDTMAQWYIEVRKVKS